MLEVSGRESHFGIECKIIKLVWGSILRNLKNESDEDYNKILLSHF